MTLQVLCDKCGGRGHRGVPDNIFYQCRKCDGGGLILEPKLQAALDFITGAVRKVLAESRA